MKLTSIALGCAAAILATPLAAQMPPRTGDDAKAPPVAESKASDVKPSSGALKAIVELQNAVKANDTANIPAKVTAAQAVAKTKEDRYLIAIFQRQAALAAKDNVALAAAVDALVNSGVLDTPKMAALYLDLGVQQFNVKQFPLAAASFQRALTYTPNDVQGIELLAQAKFAAGQNAEAVPFYQRALQLRSASGQKAPEDSYRHAVQAAYDASLPAAVDLSRQWLSAYPSNDSWRNAILIYRQIAKPDVEGTLDLLRLLQAAGVLNSPADYNLFASAAADQANYIEAQSVIDAGIAAKHVDPASPVFRDLVSGLKAKQKPTAADLAVARKSAANTRALIRIGDSYAALGDSVQAVDAYRAALAKADVDAPVANLHLGIALARAGDKAGATAAFNAVTGPRAEIAKYWLLYLQTRA
jgi:Tfp pilus assembly protein PilF